MIGANKDVRKTQQAAMLLTEAMDLLQALFVEMMYGKSGRARPVRDDEFRRRTEDAHARRMRAAVIANRLETRVPGGVIDSPRMHRSAFYPFYLASRRGLSRQFSAVDLLTLATNLLGAAEYEDDAVLAAATAERASELGVHALVLLQDAPTLGFDKGSFAKMTAAFDLVERSYEEAMKHHSQALAALNRLERVDRTAPSIGLDRPMAFTEGQLVMGGFGAGGTS